MATEYVRLTPNEFSQVLTIPVNQTFAHVNLQHDGIPVLESPENILAVKILSNGYKKDGINNLPDIDTKNAIKLQTLSLTHSLSVRSFSNEISRDLKKNLIYTIIKG